MIFCALSGAVYLVNDVADRETDRRHPLKARRPIASGQLPVTTAVAAAGVLAAAAMASAFAIGPRFAAVAATYLALQLLYSGPLKHVVIIDVLSIAIGFVLRAVAGAVAVDVEISHWLLVCTILLALFIALAKRRHEIVLLADGATHHRPILGEYSPYLLDQMIAVVTASTLMAYVFYTISPETQAKFGTPWLGLTIPFPLYGIFRYLYLVHRREGGGSPADLLLTDRPLLVCVALWALTVALIIYRPM
jgi:4-hydroxybenzoate polyprenyltransferase